MNRPETYAEWADTLPMTVREEGLARMAWDAAIENAARFMLSRKVMASEFYAAELRKLKTVSKQ